MEKPGKLKCHLVTWDVAFSLSKEMARKIKSSGFKPDIVIGISRGGLVPARIVCDLLLQKDLVSMKVEHWGIASTLGKAKIKYTLPAEVDIAGKRILIVDDVADTGDTFHVIMNYLKEKNVTEIRTAVMQYKTCSTFVPDFWGEKHEEWEWMIYPWAFYEDMTGFIQSILTSPRTQEALRKDLNNSLNIIISRTELKEVLGDMQLEGKLVKKKKGKKILWEKGEVE
jgi:hypoxanthine phosphoribosyltransferase